MVEEVNCKIRFRIAMRRDRAKKSVADENKMNVNNSNVQSVKDVREFGYMRGVDGRLIRLNWEKRKSNGFKSAKRNLKLFTIKCVEGLIEVSLRSFCHYTHF